MKIQSTHFGIQEIDPRSVLIFPRGLAGFEDCTRYTLFHEEKEQPIVHFLQSLDRPELAFSLVDPALFGLNYELTLSDEELASLQWQEGDALAVMLIAYRPEEERPASGQNVVANINGPIILNLRSRLGMQKVVVGLKPEITLKG